MTIREFLSFALILYPAAASAKDVTFNRDVAPILYQKCTGCHHP